MSSNISEINENSSESPDLVLSSTLNTYTTDLINFQSAQIEIPSEKEERMELMILNSVLIHLYSSPSPKTRENEEMEPVRDAGEVRTREEEQKEGRGEMILLSLR